MMYQHTQRASKHSAFAWTYHPMECVWTNTSAKLKASASAIVERKRSEGIDLAHISGMSSKGFSKEQLKAAAMKRPKLDTVPPVNYGSHVRIAPKTTAQDDAVRKQKIVKGGI